MTDHNIVQCDCGCNLRFITYSSGFFYVVVEPNNEVNFIMCESKVLNGSLWESYFSDTDESMKWFLNNIKENRYKDKQYEHLYNTYYKLFESKEDSRLSKEYCY